MNAKENLIRRELLNEMQNNLGLELKMLEKRLRAKQIERLRIDLQSNFETYIDRDAREDIKDIEEVNLEIDSIQNEIRKKNHRIRMFEQFKEIELKKM